MTEELIKHITTYESLDDFSKKNNLYIYKEKNLVLLKYLRNKSNINDKYTSMCRGIIFNNDTFPSKPLCYSFNARIEYSEFIKKYPISDVNITEIIDGTMINLYYYNKWEMSTKSRIKAENSKWLNQKTFKELFEEVISIKYDNLNKDYCYSFILVHPENRIVIKNKEATIYLSQVRDLVSNKIVTDLILVNTIGDKLQSLKTLETYNNYSDLEKMINEKSHNYSGVMLIDKSTGNRSRLLCPQFDNLKLLVSKYPTKNQHYLWLDKMNYTKQYFKYFGEERTQYNSYLADKNKLFSYILNIYHNSRKTYIEFPKFISKFIYLIHIEYLNAKRNNIKNTNITFNKIKIFFCNLNLNIQYHIFSNFVKLNPVITR